MNEGQTTASIQRYLDELAGVRGDAPAEPIVRDLLARAARRLHLLCATMLHRSYPRLTRAPVNLESDDMLSAVVERMLKAMREARPHQVRQFFALANRHLRWELNDMARRLDAQIPEARLHDSVVAAPPPTASGGSTQGVNARLMLDAIENLPEEEREAFSLVRIQGMTHVEAAEVFGVSAKTIQRRLNRSLILLATKLKDILPADERADETGQPS